MILAQFIDAGRVRIGDGPGALPLDVTPHPSEAPQAGCAWVPHYTVADGRIAQTWVEATLCKTRPRQISKRKLYLELSKLGVWTAVQDWIAQSPVANDWELATTLDEDNPALANAAAALAAALGITEEEVAEIIKRCYAED